MDNLAIRSLAIEPHRTQVLRSDDETARNRHSACPAARSHNNIRSMSALSRSSPTSHAA